MTDVQKAMLGDKEEADRLTEKGELLPCPFCEGLPRVVEDDFPYPGYNVFCENCGVMISASGDKKFAVSVWNTRPQLLTKEQIEALERMEKQ